jgi:hypothetical protein
MSSLPISVGELRLRLRHELCLVHQLLHQLLVAKLLEFFECSRASGRRSRTIISRESDDG